jgi:hypothetical protein
VFDDGGLDIRKYPTSNTLRRVRHHVVVEEVPISIPWVIDSIRGIQFSLSCSILSNVCLLLRVPKVTE